MKNKRKGNLSEAEEAQRAFKAFLDRLRRGKITWPFHQKCVRQIVLCSYQYAQRWNITEVLVASVRGLIYLYSLKNHLSIEGDKYSKRNKYSVGEALALMGAYTGMKWPQIGDLFKALTEGRGRFKVIGYPLGENEDCVGLDITATLSSSLSARIQEGKSA